MTNKAIKVPLYGFKVNLIECKGKEDAPELEKFFRRIKLDDDIVDEIVRAVGEGDIDGGWTLACLGVKLIVVVLLPMHSDDKRTEVLAHEKRHVEDDILRHCGIKDEEAAGYLAGFLGKYLK